MRQHPDQVKQLRALARKGPITLVYSAHDEKHNDALLLRDLLLGQIDVAAARQQSVDGMERPMSTHPPLAPELQVSQWLNTDRGLTLAGLRGQVVVIEAFQMLCPGCVHHGIPQAQRIAEHFSRGDVKVLGLHTVFEHHDVMTPAALQVFIDENRLASRSRSMRRTDDGACR